MQTFGFQRERLARKDANQCQGCPASFSLMQSNYRDSGKLSLMMQWLLTKKKILHGSLISTV